MKRTLANCACLFLTWPLPYALGCAGAEGGAFSVGVENLQYLPLHTVDSSNRYGGFAREVLDAFAAQQGYRFEYVPLPINRLYSRFLAERSLDFKYPDNPPLPTARTGHAAAGACPLPQRRMMAVQRREISMPTMTPMAAPAATAFHGWSCT